MIDTHMHLTFPDFAGRVGAVLDEAQAAGVGGVITVSTTAPDAEAGLALAESDPRVWCTAGVHPLYAHEGPHDWAGLRRVASHPRCVAWGELGLDNHYDHPPRAVQHAILADELATIQAARSEGIDKPVVIHCREAFDDLLPVLRDSGLDPTRFVFHCFTGNADDARKVLDFGAMISFTGVVTYRNAREVADAALLTPLDRLMVETDAPFLSPGIHRGKRPCVPAWARVTAEFLAELKGTPWPEFEHAINDTTERFFGVRDPGAGA